MTKTFNLGDLFEITAAAVPDRTALVCGDTHLRFGELAERSDRLAAALARRGVRRGSVVGLLMYNGVPYVESLLACFKLGAVIFNINYRYESDELFYVLDDARADALIMGEQFMPVIAALLPRLPRLKLRLVVEEGAGVAATGAGIASYLRVLDEPTGDTDIVSGRSGDDILLLYTGGTTGTPKGVEWSHKAKFFGALGGGAMLGESPISEPEQLGERAINSMTFSSMITAPLMHGTALWSTLIMLLAGQRTIMLPSKSFDAVLVWDLIDREGVTSLSFTGDAMAVPLVEAWDAHPGRWHASSLLALSWGGAPLSPHLQAELAKRFPNCYQMSGMGSSEGGFIGSGSLSTDGDGYMRLQPRDDLAVLVDGQRYAAPGEMGILARSGWLPNGYWGDPKKSAETFIHFDGRRWVLTGDQARTDQDGCIILYGRGSGCINTGGEKVFPEEVEAVLRGHPSIRDVMVVGIPDERWGQTVAVVVEPCPGMTMTLDDIKVFCEGKLARYKMPRKLVVQGELKRSPAGKADLRWATSVAQA